MNPRRVVAVALLLTFPASTLAQTPPAPGPASDRTDANAAPANRLDLTTLKHVVAEPERKPFALTFSIKTPGADFQQVYVPPPCDESAAKGRVAGGKRRFSHAWFWTSAGINTVVPFLGLIGTTAAASAVKPKPKSMPADVDQNCYLAGYADGAQKENVLTALWGSLLGTCFWVALLSARN